MKSIITGYSDNICKHCFSQLVWKAHKAITEKELQRPFYFTKWEYCRACKTVWLHEEFKVENNNAAALALQRKQAAYKEHQSQLEFIRTLQ